jgi:hypothetical protein
MRPVGSSQLCVPLLPQAYVQFFDNNGAAAAKQAISGRLFAGNTVNVQFIGAHAYAAIMQNAV